MYTRIIDRLKNIAKTAIINAVNDSDEIQLIKIEGYEGTVQDKVERVQNYGVTSNPPKNSGALIINVGSNSDHPVAIAVDCGEHRKKDLKAGEVALYDQNGSYVLLKSNGDVEINTGGKLSVLTDVESLGDVKDATGTLDELRTEFNNFVNTKYAVHTHVSAAPGSPTGPPLP